MAALADNASGPDCKMYLPYSITAVQFVVILSKGTGAEALERGGIRPRTRVPQAPPRIK